MLHIPKTPDKDVFYRKTRAAGRLPVCLLLIFLVFAPSSPVRAQDYSYINITDPSISQIPFAVTEFMAMNGKESEKDDGIVARGIMASALDFTGYIQVMNPAAFLVNPARSGITLTDINFRDWTGIGAEFLVTGGVASQGDNVKLELRLFDTFKARLVVGKVYTGSRARIRSMIHKFCAEISLHLTGRRGVFDSKIAFVSTVNSHKEIFVCDFDGNNPRQITNDKSIALSPSWSFDGQWIAYTSYARGNPDIFIRHLTRNLGTVVNLKGTNISPSWSPDNLTLAAALSFSGDQEIYLLTGKGEIIKRVTNSWGIDVSPSFSPDGDKLAFVSKRAGLPQIYIKDLKTDSVRRLTFEGNNNTSPSWSPDGEKIAYVGMVKNRINIFTIDPRGGRPVQLTSDAGDNEDPSWSPDGSMIVFSSTRDQGVPRLHVMTAGGAFQRKLLDIPGRQTGPDWSR